MRVLVLALLLAASPALADDFLFFQSPSGNISCMAMSGSWNGVRCDLGQLTMSFPRRPVDCDLDWGHAFEVGASGRGYLVCAGDTVADPGALVLPYGRSVSFGGVTCFSERSGMTCVNAGSRGFSVARARQSVF